MNKIQTTCNRNLTFGWQAKFHPLLVPQWERSHFLTEWPACCCMSSISTSGRAKVCSGRNEATTYQWIIIKNENSKRFHIKLWTFQFFSSALPTDKCSNGGNGCLVLIKRQFRINWTFKMSGKQHEFYKCMTILVTKFNLSCYLKNKQGSICCSWILFKSCKLNL